MAADELKDWFENTIELPEYYELFKKKGYNDISYLYDFDIENTDEELKEIGIKKNPHRRRIKLEIKKLIEEREQQNAPPSEPTPPPDPHQQEMKEIENKIELIKKQKELEALRQEEQQAPNHADLPASNLNPQVNDDPNHNLDRPNISAPEMGNNLASGGYSSGDNNVTVDILNDEQKAQLFKGSRELLFGRCINTKTNKINSVNKRLFELKGAADEKMNMEDIVRPIIQKKLDIYESYSAFQESLTTSTYYNMEVQGSVAGYGGASFGHSHFESNQTIDTAKKLYFTATLLIKKAKLIIDEDSVKYTDRFLKELNELLDNNVKDETKWNKFTDKYGQFYISECEIGGAAYSSREEQSKDGQRRSTRKVEFRASFEATVGITSVRSSTTHETESDHSTHQIDQSSTISLSCHGGKSSLCSPKDFNKWEDSVNHDYTLWDVINVVHVKPFYHLLPAEKQETIQELMPEKQIKKKEKPKPIYNPSKKMRVTIKSNYRSHYWSVTPIDERKVYGNKDTPGPDGTFTSISRAGNNKIALQAYSGKYVQIKQDNNGRGIHARADRIKSWETFQLYPVNEEKNIWGIKCDNDKFISSSGKGYFQGDGWDLKKPCNQFIITPL